MRFGERVRELRKAKNLTLRGPAAKVGVGFTYLSKVENERLAFVDYPSDDLICRVAKALDADADELLILAEKIPDRIRRRVLERPDAFRRLAGLDDDALDRVIAVLDADPLEHPRTGMRRAGRKNGSSRAKRKNEARHQAGGS